MLRGITTYSAPIGEGMTTIRILYLFLAVITLGMSPVSAQDSTKPSNQISSDKTLEFSKWLEELREEARSKGISEGVIQTALSDIKPVARILERDRKQSEFTINLAKYRSRVITKANIKAGISKRELHKELLKKVASKYSVQPRFILSIWGIETRFGAVKPTVPVLPAVATLAFDRRRSKYFRQQVFATLRMLQNNYIDLESLKGSWAGAMGQPQFMPSSYLAYAQDFNGDGRRDIWNDEGDVFASIANYLAKHGWKDDQTWGREVKVPSNVARNAFENFDPKNRGCRAMKKMSHPRLLSEWAKNGVTKIDGSPLPSRDLDASMIFPDGVNGPKYLVYGNYRSILRYNCAHLYAVTVGELADKLWR